VEFNSLRYFFEAARTGSIRQAAERIHVAPSAISRQIAKLEHELGSSLLERRPNGVRLTPAGELLAKQLQSTVRDLMRVRGYIDELKGLRRGEASIFIIEGLIDPWLGVAIKAFHDHHPKITFHVTVASTDSIIEALVSDETDIGIALNPARRPEIVFCGGWQEPVQAIVAPGHPLSRRSSVSLAELSKYPAALPDESFGVRRLIDRSFKKVGITLNPLITTNSILMTRSIVRQGAIYTLMPHFAVARDLESRSVVAIPITDKGMEVARVELCIHRSRELPIAAREFLATLRNLLGDRHDSENTNVTANDSCPLPAARV
jgi:DNA-binding transcriptional LysR family regulator